MSDYIDRYAAVFREAAERQARNAPTSRLRRRAPRRPAVALAAAVAVGTVVLAGKSDDPEVDVPAARPTATVSPSPAPIPPEEVAAHAVTLPPRIASLVTRSDPAKTHDALRRAGYSVRYIAVGVDGLDPAVRFTSPPPNTQILSVLGRGGGALKSDDVEQLLIELVPRR